jgi:hypothetical protein
MVDTFAYYDENLVSFFCKKIGWMETNQTNTKNKFRQGAHRPD